MHPDAVQLLELIRAAGRPAFQDLTPAEARIAYANGRNLLQPPPDEVAEVLDLAIPGPGGTLPLRSYSGAGTDGAATLPCLVYLHGGGWVVGDLDSHDGVCRRLANLGACRVIAVDYRLAPEHPFPAAVEDAAAELGVNPARIAVGGTLAAVLALLGRDGAVPEPMFQLLLYPVTDLAMDTPSYARVTEGVPLTAVTMQYFAEHYAPDPAQRGDWRASPLRAA
jgi:acetyl esterase